MDAPQWEVNRKEKPNSSVLSGRRFCVYIPAKLEIESLRNNFKLSVGTDIKLGSRLSKDMHLSRDFYHLRSYSIRKSAFVNVFWFGSDNQSTR